MKKYPERTAIVSGERPNLQHLSFAELAVKVNQLTRFLQENGAKSKLSLLELFLVQLTQLW